MVTTVIGRMETRMVNPIVERTQVLTGNPNRIMRVLVADDEHLIADTIVAILQRYGFDARGVYNGEQAVAAAGEYCPDCLITDVMMPGLTGIDVARALSSLCPETRILLFSGQAATADLLAEARAEGLEFELLPKPIHPRILIDKLRETETL